MPGMNSGLNPSDPTVVAAFKAALLHQGLIALLIFTVLGLAWVAVRAWPPAAGLHLHGAGAAGAPGSALPEPSWRRLLRIGFGVIWILDGLLQAQPKMAVGLPSQVIEPIAATSPRWVQDVVNWAGTNWSYHPMQAGASAVWIQVGIGIWMIAASRGALSRLAGLVSIGWGLVVWAFGESFGGIFAPGLTWLFGAPGAVLIYAVAGALIALPEQTWRTGRLGRLTLAGTGLFLLGMAVLQAWPGRGSWQGSTLGQPGTLATMTSAMAPTPQPHVLSAWITAFTGFDEAHGFAVNLFVVAALTVTGAVFVTGRPQLIRPVLIGFTLMCVADWVLIEDFGFFGGLGTDPNSMIPMALIAIAGYLALAPVLVTAAEPGQATAAQNASWRDRARLALDRARPAAVRQSVAAASIQSVTSVGAIGLIVLGAAPMAAAQANPVADTILAQAINGSSNQVNYPAPAFSLIDQHGRTVTLTSLRGKVILLTFLDDTCTTDCPLIAQEFRQAGQLLAADTRNVELVAINYNPVNTQVSYIQAFDRQEGLSGVPNWLYLTGAPSELQQVWHAYGLPVEVLPAGSMIGHGDYAFVIDQVGHMRQELSFDTGPGTQATKSSFAAELTDAARQLLGHA
jgi:cytochrome oxidase Cu insertion factor (SCO1/SenC/PrrC family)